MLLCNEKNKKRGIFKVFYLFLINFLVLVMVKVFGKRNRLDVFVITNIVILENN